jgi:hypothetical protein
VLGTSEPLGDGSSVGPAPLSLCESAPDAIRFPDLKGVRSAVSYDWTHLAHSLRTGLSALSFILAFLDIGGKEEMGVVAAAQGDGLPGTVG